MPSCSRCPVLDLLSSPKDAWDRMPDLKAAVDEKTGGFYREGVAKRIASYCELMRHRQGLCTVERIDVCRRALIAAVEGAPEARLVYDAIDDLCEDDDHYFALKATRPPIRLDASLIPDLRYRPDDTRYVPSEG